MANHGYQICSLCLLVMMMPERSSLKFSNQSLACLRDPFLIWFMDQLDQRPLRDMTDSSPFQCRSSLVLSIRWNRVVLRCRRCFPGVFSRHWWIFRLSADDCSHARGYGGFIWVFDPGINRILAKEKDVIKLGIGEITPLYFMGTKKNSQTYGITSHGPMALSMFGEDEEHVSVLSVSDRNTNKSSKRRLEEFSAFMEFTQAGLVVRRCSRAYSQGIRRSWYRMEKKAKSKIVQMTMIQKFWYHNVNISELIWKHQVLSCGEQTWSFSQKMVSTTHSHQSKILYIFSLYGT